MATRQETAKKKAIGRPTVAQQRARGRLIKQSGYAFDKDELKKIAAQWQSKG
ncbi:MAG TPA: hypothetical protein VM493_04865 [Vicinamibacterales bacterium]|nr:hypothetical protein [Vicinamibacterales bacterium]